MPHTRKSKPASPSRSPPRPPAAGGSPRSRDSEFSEDGDALVARFSALVDQLHVTAEENRPPAADGEEDDAQSSVSGVTAVAAARPAGPAGGAERRCQDIQDEVFAFCSAPANKVPVDARLFVMRKVSELVALCSGLMSEAAAERGAVAALRGQLAEVRREVAAVQRRAGVAECRLESLVGAVTDPACAGLPGAGFAAAVGAAASEAGRLSSVGAAGAYASGAGPMAPGAASYAAALRSGGFLDAGAAPVAPGGAARGPAQPLHDHVCFLTPTAQTTAPARDVVRLLKANIDPAAKGIKDVSLRHTRWSRRQRTSQRAADGEGTKRCPRSWWRLVRLRETSVCESRRVCARSREIARSIMAVGCFSRPAPESSGRAAFPTARASTDGH
ncbi:uncharacterized protein [Dermacentor albipictus]|uniref:uncharacterized protein isoform X2 n=1 Tax=Dermacentor albipictus TaxID=60249 RepID=UPI0031FD9A82